MLGNEALVALAEAEMLGNEAVSNAKSKRRKNILSLRPGILTTNNRI